MYIICIIYYIVYIYIYIYIYIYQEGSLCHKMEINMELLENAHTTPTGISSSHSKRSY